MSMDIFKTLNQILDKTGSNLVVMVGPPGSGKSAIADKLVSEYGFAKVSPNDIRTEKFGDPYSQSDNETVFNIAYSRIGHYLDNGWNVVYDATNCRPAYRYRIMDYVGDQTTNKICLCATTGVLDCIINAQKVIPGEKVAAMHQTLRKHPPSVFEGFDIVLRFDGSEL